MIAYLLTVLPASLSPVCFPLLLQSEKRKSTICSFLVATIAALVYAMELYLSTRGIVTLPPVGNPGEGKVTGVTILFTLPVASGAYFTLCLLVDWSLRVGQKDAWSTSHIGLGSALMSTLVLTLVYGYFHFFAGW